jgi:putative oxidoreductase
MPPFDTTPTSAVPYGHDTSATTRWNPDFALLVGRVLLVAIFPISAYYKVTGWPGVVTTLAQQGLPLPTFGGYLAILVEFLLPALVLLGVWTRWAMLGLIVYTAATMFIAHRFWEFAPPQQFGQMMQFMKNLAMIGGMVAVAALGPGRYALRH